MTYDKFCQHSLNRKERDRFVNVKNTQKQMWDGLAFSKIAALKLFIVLTHKGQLITIFITSVKPQKAKLFYK